MKCRYKYCRFGGEVDKSQAVKDGNQYYHKECYQEKEDKAKIRQLYVEYIDKNVNYSILNRTINNIVNSKGISSDFLLFTVMYIVSNKMNINTPMGLYYYIDNQRIKDAYNEYKLKERAKKLNPLSAKTIVNEVKEYRIQENKGWASILR